MYRGIPAASRGANRAQQVKFAVIPVAVKVSYPDSGSFHYVGPTFRTPIPTFRSLMWHIAGILKSCSMSTVSGFLSTEGIHGVITDPLVSGVIRNGDGR